MKFKDFLDLKPKCILCKIVLLVVIVSVFTTTDLIVKDVVYRNLRHENYPLQRKDDVVVIKGFWNYRYTQNDDIGFSILSWMEKFLSPTAKRVFLCCLQGFGTAIVICFYFYSKRLKFLVPFALIISGALGNFLERCFRGFVVDYIMWYHKSFIWPIFNLADVFTVVGAFMLILILIFYGDDEDKPSAETVSQS